MNMSRFLPWLALLAIWANTAASQTWTPLKNAPPVDIGYIALATDGTVLAHARTFSSADSQWYKLTPDINGSYVNGTWSQLASMPSGYAPIDFAGGVLADGKLLVPIKNQLTKAYLLADPTAAALLFNSTDTGAQITVPPGSGLAKLT